MGLASGDDEDMAAVARGDRLAFARLVARHRARLTALAARIAGPAVAEDVVQETFTRAWTHAPRWSHDRPGSVGGWLARVATNLSIDQRRKPSGVALDEAPEPADGAEAADARLIRLERNGRLAVAMASLPERQRAAIALTYDAGCSNAEGAEAMSVSVGAFELLLVRARRGLRAALTEDVV